MKIDQLVNQVYCGEALRFLRKIPSACIDTVLADGMFGLTREPKPKQWYAWGPDPIRGCPYRYWAVHGDTYHECLRVLKLGGKLAWCMGNKFRKHFPEWFGGYRIWSLARIAFNGRSADPFNPVWIVQTKEQEPIRQPDADPVIEMRTKPSLLKCHPCPKSEAEMRFMVEHLSRPGDIILDPFCGIGTTMVAANQLGRRYIGCDLWPGYCQVALWRLREVND